MKVYQELARVLGGSAPDSPFVSRREARLAAIMDTAPSGSGWDCGTKLATEPGAKYPGKLEFFGSFHHMNENGYYDGWTDHSIIVKPDLAFGIDIRVTGRDRNDIKDYLAELFWEWLESDITEHVDGVMRDKFDIQEAKA